MPQYRLAFEGTPKDSSMNIEQIAVIGAGTMGNGIAQVCAVAGYRVTLIDVADIALQRALATLGKNLERQVDKQTLTREQADAALTRIGTSTDYAELSSVQLVIEAATENLALKQRILQQVVANVGPDCLIATNTSSLSITQLAATVEHPERFIGVHFFNPVPMMALVEVIRGLQTSDSTYAQALLLTEKVGKTPISAGNRPGFVVNRILAPMINEAIFVRQEGLASAEDIDTGMRLGCNQPIGPLALADLIGLDTLLAIMEAFHEGFSDSKYRPAPLLKEMVAAGYLGRKSGRGFFTY
jgi:3-hydroxybutyryl-CoA dehydrogenase